MNETSCAGDDVRAALLQPPVRAVISEVRATWRFCAVRVVTEKVRDFDFWPELPVRIRGAFGQALHRLPARFDRRGRPRMRAVEGLFDHGGWLAAGHEIAKPFTLRAWPEANTCIVELRLFGMADQWLEEAVEALVEALEGGIAIKAERSFRVPMPVLEVLTAATGGLLDVERASSAMLAFRSPVAVRRDARHVFHPLAVVSSVIKRAESLAPWHLVGLDHDRPSLRTAVEALTIDDRDLTPYHWERHSRNGGDRAINVAGQIGSLRLSGHLAPLIDYLLVAESCNTGSHSALGLGWFDLVLYP